MSKGSSSTGKKVSAERWEALRREYRQRHTTLSTRTADSATSTSAYGARSATADDSSSQ
jgi:hypothetical protein